jgi:hypothetical protein
MKKTTLLLAGLLTTTLTFANTTESQTLDFGAIKSFLENSIANLDFQAPENVAAAPMYNEETTELDIDFQGMKDFLNRHLNK